MALLRDVDAELYEALLDESLYFRRGGIVKSRLAAALGIKVSELEPRLAAARRLLGGDL